MALSRHLAVGLALTLGGLDPVASVSAVTRSAPKVSPALDPESHKTFYKKDYPLDANPSPSDGHDTMPLQEEAVYDKDFVKDENGDGEAWQHEAEYEKLKARLARARASVKESGKKEETAKQTVKAEKEEEAALKKELSERAAKAASRKKAAVEAARAKVKAAQAKYDGAMAKTPGGAAVADAERDLLAHKKKCEELRKKLEDARAKLAVLKKERDDALAAEKAAVADEAAAVQLETEKNKVRDKAAGKLKAETAAFNAAHQKYEKELLALHKIEEDLKVAESKLRGFRTFGASSA